MTMMIIVVVVVFCQPDHQRYSHFVVMNQFLLLLLFRFLLLQMLWAFLLLLLHFQLFDPHHYQNLLSSLLLQVFEVRMQWVEGGRTYTKEEKKGTGKKRTYRKRKQKQKWKDDHHHHQNLLSSLLFQAFEVHNAVGGGGSKPVRKAKNKEQRQKRGRNEWCKGSRSPPKLFLSLHASEEEEGGGREELKPVMNEEDKKKTRKTKKREQRTGKRGQESKRDWNPIGKETEDKTERGKRKDWTTMKMKWRTRAARQTRKANNLDV